MRLANAQATDTSRTNLLQASLRQANLGQSNLAQENLRRTEVLWTNANPVPVVFTETFLVIVQDGNDVSTGHPVYQIQWWRVTVLHPALNSNNNKIPAKQT
jgi:hypothetical protein